MEDLLHIFFLHVQTCHLICQFMRMKRYLDIKYNDYCLLAFSVSVFRFSYTQTFLTDRYKTRLLPRTMYTEKVSVICFNNKIILKESSTDGGWCNTKSESQFLSSNVKDSAVSSFVCYSFWLINWVLSILLLERPEIRRLWKKGWKTAQTNCH